MNNIQKKTMNKKVKKTPYGIFKGATITEKEIDEITHSWNRIIDEIG